MLVDKAKHPDFDLKGFLGKNNKDRRYPEILASAKALKQEFGFKKVGAIGYCYGGWAVFQLGAKGEYDHPHHTEILISEPGNNLVDAISTPHPSLLTKEEVNAVGVPVQVIAPEHDPALTPELKEYMNSVIPGLNVEYDYQYFPGVSHGFAARADQNNKLERQSLERAKNVAVAWFAQFLHLH